MLPRNCAALRMTWELVLSFKYLQRHRLSLCRVWVIKEGLTCETELTHLPPPPHHLGVFPAEAEFHILILNNFTVISQQRTLGILTKKAFHTFPWTVGHDYALLYHMKKPFIVWKIPHYFSHRMPKILINVIVENRVIKHIFSFFTFFQGSATN